MLAHFLYEKCFSLFNITAKILLKCLLNVLRLLTFYCYITLKPLAFLTYILCLIKRALPKLSNFPNPFVKYFFVLFCKFSIDF